MENVKKVWDWVVFSSKDKNKLSLSLMAGVPALVWIFAFAGHGNIDMNLGNELAEKFADFASKGVEFGLSGIALFAVLRKVWLTLFPPKKETE